MNAKFLQHNLNMTTKQRGFSLLELTIAIIAIGILVSAITMGSNLQRNASYQRLASSFVRAWELAYLAYFNGTGIVLGDNSTTPTTKVNAGSGSMCSTALRTAMMAAGVQMPNGRANGFEDHFSYLDSNGNPQDTDVCFQNVTWSVNAATPGNYVTQLKNVMIISGLTPDLAKMLDAMIDGNPDARFGAFREAAQAPSLAGASVDWSKDNTVKYGSGTALDEDQVAVVTAYWLMNP